MLLDTITVNLLLYSDFKNAFNMPVGKIDRALGYVTIKPSILGKDL